MKFTLSWLREHLDFNHGSDDLNILSESLTSLGLEVETLVDPRKNINGFKVGCVTEYYKHPNADKLNICKVDIGNEIAEVICGANNLKEGMKVVFAPIGAVIPETKQKLKKSKIRGVFSNGMLCSERELCISKEHDGIIELNEKSITGIFVDGFANVPGSTGLDNLEFILKSEYSDYNPTTQLLGIRTRYEGDRLTDKCKSHLNKFHLKTIKNAILKSTK